MGLRSNFSWPEESEKPLVLSFSAYQRVPDVSAPTGEGNAISMHHIVFRWRPMKAMKSLTSIITDRTSWWGI